MMMFKKGDKVAFKDDVGMAEVLEIRSDGHLLILDEHGFERVVSSDILVLQNDLECFEIGEPPIKKADIRPPKKKPSPPKKADKWVVDLHLSRGGTGHLQQQLTMFEEGLQHVMDKGYKKVVFIHGKGDGILRRHIETRLRDKGLSFQETHYAPDGSGALEVVF